MSCHLTLRVEGVTYAYPGGDTALHNADLLVPSHGRVGLVGASGAGKSTLISLLNGYRLPGSGRILLRDEILGKGNREWFRRQVGIVFADPDDQLFMPTVREDVAFGLLARGEERATAKEKAEQVLDSLGMAGIAGKAPHELSDGQKKVAALAGVLVMEPAVLVLDEPSAHLDPGARRRLIRLLEGLHGAILIAGHDLDLVYELCSECAVLADGRTLKQGPTRELLADREFMEKAGLELPLGLQGTNHPVRRGN